MSLKFQKLNTRATKACTMGLMFNWTISSLDLQGCEIGPMGTKYLCDVLQQKPNISDLKNTHLEVLNVAWNGFEIPGCHGLGHGLEGNKTLIELNVGTNRIGLTALCKLLEGLKYNSTLERLNLADNPLTSRGTLLVLQVIEKCSNVKNVDFGMHPVEEELLDKLREIQEIKPLTVLHGKVHLKTKIGDGDPTMYLSGDPICILFEFARIKEIPILDLFIAFDTDDSHSLSWDEFKEGLLINRIPLRSGDIDHLIRNIDINRDGEINFTELVIAQKSHNMKVKKLLDRGPRAFANSQVGKIHFELHKWFHDKEVRKSSRPPPSRDGGIHTNPTVLAAKYRHSSTSSTKLHMQNPTKVVRQKRVELDIQVQKEMEKMKAEEEERKKREQREEIERRMQIEDIEDVDYDEDDSPFEDEVLYDFCQRLYMEACKDLNITPINLVIKHLATNKLAIVGVVLGKKDAKACAIALLRNSTVETLVLDGNHLGGAGCRYFGDVISVSTYLTDIKIAENNLGSDGAKDICYALKNNNVVRRLDLSGNGFTEEDAEYFKEMLDENHALRELYLSHNKFQEKGGEVFADGLANNDFLRVLDLSWNHLRMGGAKAIGTALQSNRHLEKLNISWNGFHVRGALSLAKALEVNTTLLEMDLSCNRLGDLCVQAIVKGLQKNATLKVLRLAQNHINPEGAMHILGTIDATPSIALELLDLGDRCVTDKFENLYHELQKKRSPFKVIYGMVWQTDRRSLSSYDREKEEEDLAEEDPLTVLFEYARLQNFRLIDMFKNLDTDNSGSLDKQEFIDGLAMVNIPMTKKGVARLINRMDVDNDGEIDFGELIIAQKQHKEKLKNIMKSDVPWENTDIARIDKLLRKVIYKRFLMRKF
ncbi:hypothetical protein FSP39_019892 [Pinctada imbricata]|uniref:EF-hand domain-containing protein n=1 Tax=Pinctada imbricata TaxID=66713 RepID=A0AA89C5P8_PINIB|nr:hypothetical protein FSP39_019892 [Pinctada imbricata]